MNSSDIHAKKFKTKMNGYTPMEVDDFLEVIAREMDKMNDELDALREKNGAMIEQLAEYRGMERALRESMVTAQKTSITVVDDARTQAQELALSAQEQSDRIIEEAAITAENMISDATEKTAAIYEGEKNLRILMDDYRRQIRMVMSTQLAAMEDIFSYQNEEEEFEDETDEDEIDEDATA